jgi:putative flippase GtrA
MKKIDIVLAIITGEIVAWSFYGILKTAKIDIGLLALILFILFPLITLFCLWIAFLIGRKFLFVFQVAKFVLVGVLATIVDLGAFSGLILISGIAAGFYASVFKGITFIAATGSKYFLDKFWAFEKMEKTGMGKEFSQFFIVTLIGFAANVGLFSFINNNIGPQFGIETKLWANLAALSAAVLTAAWNFFAYKFIVFKK